MSKYINADEFKKKLRERYKAGIIGKKTLICEFKAINEMPAADVRENIHREWRFVSPFNYQCSWCSALTSIQFNFCPNCGADMRGCSE